MRKVFLPFGLWLLLLLGQHGAVLHELSHVCAAATAHVSVQPDSCVEKTCELCLGYSQLANSVAHSVPLVLVERAPSLIGTERLFAASPVDLPTPRSRGPPA
jgi:hypothetical protein